MIAPVSYNPSYFQDNQLAYRISRASALLRVCDLPIRPGIWQLPQRGDLSSAPAEICGLAGIGMPGLWQCDRALRQHAGIELDGFARPLPKLQDTHLAA